MDKYVIGAYYVSEQHKHKQPRYGSAQLSR